MFILQIFLDFHFLDSALKQSHIQKPSKPGAAIKRQENHSKKVLFLNNAISWDSRFTSSRSEESLMVKYSRMQVKIKIMNSSTTVI
jgi:hypothetical protein